MAVYFDSAVLTTKVSNDLDPTRELWTWLSYKVRDWASKVGSDYAETISDHTTWNKNGEGLNVNSSLSVQVNLYSDANRAGTSSNTVGIDWYTTSNDFTFNMYWDPTTQRTNGGYWNTSSVLGMANIYNSLDDADLAQGRPSYVIYSDTPGMRYFFAKLDGRNGTGWSTCISEIKSVDKYAGGLPGVDTNWIITTNYRNTNQNAAVPFYVSVQGNGAMNPTSDKGGFMGEHANPSYMGGGFMLNRMLINSTGTKWGLSNDAIAWSANNFQDFQTARIDGHDFINAGYQLWLRTDV